MLTMVLRLAWRNQLDDITSGKEEWIKVLDKFWNDFNNNVSNVKEKELEKFLIF